VLRAAALADVDDAVGLGLVVVVRDADEELALPGVGGYVFGEGLPGFGDVEFGVAGAAAGDGGNLIVGQVLVAAAAREHW